MKHFLILLVIAFTAVSCKKDPYPLNDLAGYWGHDFAGYSGTGKAEEYIHFELYCSGDFGITIKTYTDVDSTNGCFTAYYLEGISGTYIVKKDELILKGVYTTRNMFMPPHCYRTFGPFEQTYKIEKLDYQTLKLKRIKKEPADDLIAVDIPLVKRIALECDQ